ncbi:MAG: N-formylglutamate amidohydrolase [Gammaproteobacteria bacterium]
MTEQWIRRPTGDRRLPVLVSIPHYGTKALPDITADDYADPAYTTFAYGFADAFAADLYGALHSAGATLLVFPYSRLFVDVNRKRDDFELHNGEVRSERGVVRTHTIADRAVFAEPISPQAVEDRLKAYYDPYHRTLRELVDEMHEEHGQLLLVDAHTGSERGMGEHEIILGTGRGVTSDARFSRLAADIFRSYGFTVHHDVPGYSGGYTVRHYSEPQARQIHALQIEVKSTLLMAGTRQEFMDSVRRAEVPASDAHTLLRLRACVADVLEQLAENLGAQQ